MTPKMSLRHRDFRYESEADVADEKPNQDRKSNEHSEEFDRFEDALKKLVKVPKEELDGVRAKQEREKREQEKRAG